MCTHMADTMQCTFDRGHSVRLASQQVHHSTTDLEKLKTGLSRKAAKAKKEAAPDGFKKSGGFRGSASILLNQQLP